MRFAKDVTISHLLFVDDSLVFTKDLSGKIVAVGIKQAQLKENVNFAEAKAIEWALQVAKNAALSHLIVESYSQEVVALVNNTKGSRTSICWIIAEIQN